MKPNYAERLARAANLTPEQQEPFLAGLPDRLFTDAERAEIAAKLDEMGTIALDALETLDNDGCLSHGSRQLIETLPEFREAIARRNAGR